MPVELQTKPIQTTLADLKPGQIAIVTDGKDPDFVNQNTIVQRSYDSLFIIGLSGIWHDAYLHSYNVLIHKCRILEKGETLVIT